MKLTKSNKFLINSALILVAVLIAVTLFEAFLKFNKAYTYVGFVRNEEAGVEIKNERAIALTELEQCKQEKQAAIEAGNADLFTNK